MSRIPIILLTCSGSPKKRIAIPTTTKKFRPTAAGYANDMSILERAAIQTKAEAKIAIKPLRTRGDLRSSTK